MRVTTQAEFDAAVAAGKVPECAAGYFEVYDSAQVTAYGSAQVTASDSAQVTVYGSAQVTASAYVAVTIHGDRVKACGGVQIRVPALVTVAAWLAFYGVPVRGGVATLYKAVRDDYCSAHGLSYAPGTIPVAPDWDNGDRECGGGLHFSPRPWMGLAYDPEGTRFVACRVRVSDIRCPKATDNYPDKVKARGCCGKVRECDADGKLLPMRKSVEE